MRLWVGADLRGVLSELGKAGGSVWDRVVALLVMSVMSPVRLSTSATCVSFVLSDNSRF